MNKYKGKKLPEIFRSLMWSYKFLDINTENDKRGIIVNSINYGDLNHWQWKSPKLILRLCAACLNLAPGHLGLVLIVRIVAL